MPIRQSTSTANQGANHSDGDAPTRLMAMAR